MTTLPRKIWVNIYSPFAGLLGTAYASREVADQMATRDRIACLEIDLKGCKLGDRFMGIVRMGSLK